MVSTKRVRELRQHSTWAEKLMWRWLRNRRFNSYKFRRQHAQGDYCLDFFCEEARLCIELDGFGHGHPEKVRCDKKRDEELAALGIVTLRFWNRRLREEPEVVRGVIFEALQARAPHPLPDYTRPGAAGKPKGDSLAEIGPPSP